MTKKDLLECFVGFVTAIIIGTASAIAIYQIWALA